MQRHPFTVLEGRNMINRASLDEMIRLCKDDPDLLEAVRDALLSFEEYHSAIYTMETKRRILAGTADAKQFQEEVTGMDRIRTSRHNTVLANVKMLNRIAEQFHLPPVYDGAISEQQPYRRQVADAVLGYVQDIILERP